MTLHIDSRINLKYHKGTSCYNIGCRLLVFFLLVVHPTFTKAQDNEQSIFWKVSGNGLRKPSFLFGTFHLMGYRFVDSLKETLKALENCDIIVGELVTGSVDEKILNQALLKDITLDSLLGKDLYNNTNEWLHELGGFDLSILNKMKPMLIEITMLGLVQQKYFPQAIGPAIDDYFQLLGKGKGKKVMGLESAEFQMQTLLGTLSLERQVAVLAEFVKNKAACSVSMGKMFNAYRAQKISEFMALLDEEEGYSEAERKKLLEDRNANWMKGLPGIFQRESAFVAVGALHLYGPFGLISLLREKGFHVEPMAIR